MSLVFLIGQQFQNKLANKYNELTLMEIIYGQCNIMCSMDDILCLAQHGWYCLSFFQCYIFKMKK